LTVLLIDDEPAILDGLTLVLEGWECEVLAFDDLEGLREGLESGGFEAPPDVIIADYRLGERETGVDAVTLIRTHFAQPVPALLLTGDTAPQRLREADASGLPLLHKPVKPEVLRGAIADLLAGGLTLEDTTQESTASGVRLLL
jgi:CheY-like chemotaxis protein